MISGFSNTVRQDVGAIVNRLQGNAVEAIPFFPLSTDSLDAENIKIILSATRIFAAMGMGVGAILALRAAVSSPLKGFFLLACSVGVYVFNHDVFMLAKNATELANPAQNVIEELVDVVNKFLGGAGENDDDQPHSLVKDTFLPSVWDNVLQKFIPV